MCSFRSIRKRKAPHGGWYDGGENALEASLTADGIKPDGGYLLAGSGETAVTLTRESVMADGMTSVNTTDATATVYFGNWFGLHPTAPLTGGFVNGGETGYGYCAIDEYTAARLFGSVDVCGLDITVNGFMYTVTAVVPADRGTYSGYYGYTPRIWLLYNSPAMLSERLTFTSLEAVLPSMTTGARAASSSMRQRAITTMRARSWRTPTATRRSGSTKR